MQFGDPPAAGNKQALAEGLYWMRRVGMADSECCCSHPYWHAAVISLSRVFSFMLGICSHVSLGYTSPIYGAVGEPLPGPCQKGERWNFLIGASTRQLLLEPAHVRAHHWTRPRGCEEDSAPSTLRASRTSEFRTWPERKIAPVEEKRKRGQALDGEVWFRKAYQVAIA